MPANFAGTRDPLVVYSSNIQAILGLRASSFVLAAALILVLMGIKMLASYRIQEPLVTAAEPPSRRA